MYTTTNDKNTISKNYPKIITKYGNVEQQWRRGGYVKQCENKSSVYEADPEFLRACALGRKWPCC